MATARALSITEIVVEIVEHANMLPERSPVLARLARVNWMFHHHAVKLLWADLPNLEPLFMLLSNCVRVPTRQKAASDMRRTVPLGSHSLVSRRSCVVVVRNTSICAHFVMRLLLFCVSSAHLACLRPCSGVLLNMSPDWDTNWRIYPHRSCEGRC